MLYDVDIDYVDPQDVMIGLTLGAITGIAITAFIAIADHPRKKKSNKIEPRADDIVIPR